MALRTDGNQRYNWIKNTRSLLVNWTRLRTLRSQHQLLPQRSVLCLKLALGPEERGNRFKRKTISAAIATEVKRCCQPIKTGEVFGTHTYSNRAELEGASDVSFHLELSKGDASMARLASTALMVALMTTVASAQSAQTTAPNREQAGPSAQIMPSLPNDPVTVTHWYKQNVYDPADNKIGEVMDVLVDKSGKVSALIVGVGGFLGAGEKDVAVPFDAVRTTQKGDNKWYLVMNSTKDALKNAKGFKYDRSAMTWIPEDQARTTGTSANPGPAPAPRPSNR